VTGPADYTSHSPPSHDLQLDQTRAQGAASIGTPAYMSPEQAEASARRRGATGNRNYSRCGNLTGISPHLIAA
jgi:hypothetical protein